MVAAALFGVLLEVALVDVHRAFEHLSHVKAQHRRALDEGIAFETLGELGALPRADHRRRAERGELARQRVAIRAQVNTERNENNKTGRIMTTNIGHPFLFDIIKRGWLHA